MSANDRWVVESAGGGWAVEQADGERVSDTLPTEPEALVCALSLVRDAGGGEVYLKDAHGKIHHTVKVEGCADDGT